MMIAAVTILAMVVAVSEGVPSIECGKTAMSIMKKYIILNGTTCYLPSGSSSNDSSLSLSKVFTNFGNTAIMFRIVAGGGTGGASFFMSGTGYNVSVTDFGGNKNLNFKSSLFEEWQNIKPVLVNVTLCDSGSNVLAWLAFNVGPTDTSLSWFQAASINSSYPWTASILRTRPYSYFSIPGNTGGGLVKRTIYIHITVATCTNDIGVFGVYESPDSCSYVAGISYAPFTIPKIIFAVNNGDAGILDMAGVFAAYLEMVATYSPSIKIIQ